MRRTMRLALVAAAAALTLGGNMNTALAKEAFLEITLKIDTQDRPAAAAVYNKYKAPFLKDIPGATAKRLLVRDDDVQVLHEFKSSADAHAYLKSDLFNNDVVSALKPLLKANPEIRIYDAD
jgi:ABC-type glycerol-3-phosphate transport system substrate-binding protein